MTAIMKESHYTQQHKNQPSSHDHIVSILMNTAGLASNLIALYCVHWVYENPYAVGFGGHFQVTTYFFPFFLNNKIGIFTITFDYD